MNSSTLVQLASVKKRDGTTATFNKDRIIRAIALATYEALHGSTNPHRGDAVGNFGLTDGEFARCGLIANLVESEAVKHFGASGVPTVEQIQDLVQLELLKAGEIQIVSAFIKYRTEHAEIRPIKHGENGLQDFVAISRYCRYSKALGRREVWSEAVARVRDMHLTRFAKKFVDGKEVAALISTLIAKGDITEEAVQDAGGFYGLEREIRTAFDLVNQKRILPSMRSLQFGGTAIEKVNARMFNCSFTPANRVEFFKEYFHLLLCGCGVGLSVQKHHVAMLPPLATRGDEVMLEVQHYVIPDTIEGWADSIDRLMDSYYKGYKLEMSYHQIRRRGSILKTSGGTAPGHIPLKRAHEQCASILNRAAGRSLRSIEVYDLCMHIAAAVLSGGIRRSATIVLFSPDDDEMMSAKTGDWFSENPQRTASNNSALLVRSETTRAQFDKLFECQKAFGEPGFYFAENREVGCNPCVEIGLNPTLMVTEKVRDQLISYGYDKPVRIGETLTGVQMCNLTTLAGRTSTTPEEFFKQAKYAALIGTLQADYTDMPYLGAITRVINEREALIGVSICGVLDNPTVLLDPETLRRGAEVVKATNAVIAALIGINRAARTTCVKPEGTSSLVLNCGSGISPHHSRRSFRRVQANNADPVYLHFKAKNPHMVERYVHDKNGATDIITFPVEGPENAIYRDDMTALRHLEYIRTVQENWVVPGRAYATFTDGHHNVSNTVNIDPADWAIAADFIWENRHSFTGVALFQNSNDKVYVQAPRESISTDADIRKWNSLQYQPVDFTQIPHKEDETAGEEHRGAATACAGGQCSI